MTSNESRDVFSNRVEGKVLMLKVGKDFSWWSGLVCSGTWGFTDEHFWTERKTHCASSEKWEHTQPLSAWEHIVDLQRPWVRLHVPSSTPVQLTVFWGRAYRPDHSELGQESLLETWDMTGVCHLQVVWCPHGPGAKEHVNYFPSYQTFML